MNADDLKSLPRYITAPDSEMWGPMPDGFTITNEDSIFVKLKDVEALFPNTVTMCEKTIVQDGVEYVSVGMGGVYLTDLAMRCGWDLHADLASEKLTPAIGCSVLVEYFIKKEKDDA